MGNKKKEQHQIICFCNNVPRDVIEGAIESGCDTLNAIYDQTTAGVGPCGGSCRRKIAPILEAYLSTGKFPPLIQNENSTDVTDATKEILKK